MGTLATSGVVVAALIAALSRSPAVLDEAETFGHRVVNVYPHDADAYTQGLIYRDGFLYESTGRNGRSTLRKVMLETGQVLQRGVALVAYALDDVGHVARDIVIGLAPCVDQRGEGVGEAGRGGVEPDHGRPA